MPAGSVSMCMPALPWKSAFERPHYTLLDIIVNIVGRQARVAAEASKGPSPTDECSRRAPERDAPGL